MKISDFPQDLEPRVGDILEIEQGDVCFEVRIIGITADGYLCEQDNVQGAVLLEGVSLDHDDVADITGYITEEKVRLDPKCWKGKKIGNPKTKIKGGVRVNNCVPEGQQDVAESTEQSLQKKIQAKRDALGLAREQRRARGQHQQGQREIKLQAEIDELSNQLTQMKKQDVAEDISSTKKKISKYEELALAANRAGDDAKCKQYQQKIQVLKQKMSQGVAEGYTGRETKDGTWRVFKDGQAVAVAGPFNSRDEAHAWIKKHKQGVSEAKSLKKRVRVVQGEHAGKTGWIREIKHGIHSTAPKRYYVDIDGGGQADNLPASALRLLKNQSDNQKGMAEGGYPSPHNYDSDEDYYAAVNRYLGKKGPRPGDDDWEETAPGDDIPSRRRHRDDDMDEAKYQGREVPLGKKMAGDVAKSKVYVRKPNGKVVKVNFGDKNMRIKKSNPARRKSFRARHNCDNPGPRWKARYWSCKSW